MNTECEQTLSSEPADVDYRSANWNAYPEAFMRAQAPLSDETATPIPVDEDQDRANADETIYEPLTIVDDDERPVSIFDPSKDYVTVTKSKQAAETMETNDLGSRPVSPTYIIAHNLDQDSTLQDNFDNNPPFSLTEELSREFDLPNKEGMSFDNPCLLASDISDESSRPSSRNSDNGVAFSDSVATLQVRPSINRFSSLSSPSPTKTSRPTQQPDSKSFTSPSQAHPTIDRVAGSIFQSNRQPTSDAASISFTSSASRSQHGSFAGSVRPPHRQASRISSNASILLPRAKPKESKRNRCHLLMLAFILLLCLLIGLILLIYLLSRRDDGFNVPQTSGLVNTSFNTWGEWSECDCEEGNSKRVRICKATIKTCSDTCGPVESMCQLMLKENTTDTCDQNSCGNGNFGPWSDYSPCMLLGQGKCMKERHRICTDENCPGIHVPKEMVDCDYNECSQPSTTSTKATTTTTTPVLFEDCKDAFARRPYHGKRVLTLYPDAIKNKPLKVVCDGQWTVIFQRSMNGGLDFSSATWEKYKLGFGQVRSPESDFFIGNEKLYKVTSHSRPKLKLLMITEEGKLLTATIENFWLGDERNSYEFRTNGNYHGNVSNGNIFHCRYTLSLSNLRVLNIHVNLPVKIDSIKSVIEFGARNEPFQTIDRKTTDNDCVSKENGAWWYQGKVVGKFEWSLPLLGTQHISREISQLKICSLIGATSPRMFYSPCDPNNPEPLLKGHVRNFVKHLRLMIQI